MAIVSPSDGSGRLFIVEQGGLIRVLSGGAVLNRPFLDLRDRVTAGSEQGLLGLAFHPGYACDGRFFVNYTDTEGNTALEEYAVSTSDRNRAAPSLVLLWIGDVGQNALEEIDHSTSTSGSGANFGWNRMEGSSCYRPRSACDRTGLKLPVAQYDHSSGDCSVTGGYVYRGAAIGLLAGWYLFSDYCSGTIRALGTRPGAKASVILMGGGNVSTFGEDEAGELYVADLSGGTISQIEAAP